jgi:CHAT domain-containing protein
VAIVSGPDLKHATDEARAVAGATLSGIQPNETSEVDGILNSMDGARMLHAVCHGQIRSDNPLFSSLRLHSGNLFAYQVQRLRRAPRTAVLSACHLGLGAGPAGNSLLGFTDALLSAGTSRVIASTLPVPDTSVTVELMADLHRRMTAGERPATALANAHASLPDDIAPFYGAAFTCFGAG